MVHSPLHSVPSLDNECLQNLVSAAETIRLPLLTKCELAALQVSVWLGMGMGVAAHTCLAKVIHLHGS